MTDKQFAVGDWTFDGEACPISKCGLTDHMYASEVGEDFDERAYAECDIDEGLISEQEASDIWRRMTIYYEDLAYQDHSGFSDMYKTKLELAEKVANKLNW